MREESTTDAKKRRTEGSRPGGRSARVVRDVLDAAYEELLRVGYSALRVEDVAARADVNKTTIYRRWPTKIDLVRDCFDRQEEPALREQGVIRTDLVNAVTDALERLVSPEKVGMIRMLQAERDDPEIAAIAKDLRIRHRALRVALVERAITRGELPRGVDAALVVEMILSTVYTRVMRHDEPVDRGFVEAVVDHALAGARACAASHRPERRA